MTVDWTEPFSSTNSWRGTTLAQEYVNRQLVTGVELYQRRSNVSEMQLLIEYIIKTMNYHTKNNQSNHQTILQSVFATLKESHDLFFGEKKCNVLVVQ